MEKSYRLTKFLPKNPKYLADKPSSQHRDLAGKATRRRIRLRSQSLESAAERPHLSGAPQQDRKIAIIFPERT